MTGNPTSGSPANDSGRDHELGALLRGLDVPPHAPDFEVQLRDALVAAHETETNANETPMTITVVPDLAPAEQELPEIHPAARRRWKRNTLRAVTVAAAASVVAVAVGIGVRGPGGTQLVPPPRAATAAEVTAKVQQALAEVRTLRGTLTARTLDREDANGTPVIGEVKWRFVVTGEGDFRLSGITRTEEIAYDVSEGVQRTYSVDPDGKAFAAEGTGLAAGRPDESPAEWVLQRQLGSTVRALLASEGTTVQETTYEGRSAWALDTPVQANKLSDISGDRLEIVVDRATGYPVRTTETKAGALVSEYLLSDLVTNGPVTEADFTLTIPPGAETFRHDAGWRRVSLDEVRGTVGYAPLVPATLPKGYELTTIAVADESGTTGVEGLNPLTREAVSMSFTRGLDRIVVSTRLRESREREGGLRPSYPECRECLPGTYWSDPLASGEGFIDSPETVTLRGGALDGLSAQVLVDPRTVPHVWTVSDTLVVTVSGDATREELLAMAQSLTPHSG